MLENYKFFGIQMKQRREVKSVGDHDRSRAVTSVWTGMASRRRRCLPWRRAEERSGERAPQAGETAVRGPTAEAQSLEGSETGGSEGRREGLVGDQVGIHVRVLGRGVV